MKVLEVNDFILTFEYHFNIENQIKLLNILKLLNIKL